MILLARSHVIYLYPRCVSFLGFFLLAVIVIDGHFFPSLSSRGDFPVPHRPLVVSRWRQASVRHHQRHPGAQDGAAHVHRHAVPNGEGVPLP